MRRKESDKNQRCSKAEKASGELAHSCFPSSACRIMTEGAPRVFLSATVGDVGRMMKEKIKELETVNYIYVVDKENKLRGVLSIKELFRRSENTPVEKLMETKLVTARPHTHRERIAYLALENNLKAVPVVDKDNILLGVVSNDVISAVIHQEASEDFLRMAGVHRPAAVMDNILELSAFQSLKHRFPWLFIGLLGGIVVAQIIGVFESVLEKNLLLAAFIPLVVYMASAVGEQMRIFIIRDLAVNRKLDFMSYFLKHLGVVFLMSILFSVFLYIFCLLIYKNASLGFVLAVALFVAILSSILTGLLIPYAFSKFRIDPANASGPIATIIQDALNVIIYFSIASLML